MSTLVETVKQDDNNRKRSHREMMNQNNGSHNDDKEELSPPAKKMKLSKTEDDENKNGSTNNDDNHDIKMKSCKTEHVIKKEANDINESNNENVDDKMKTEPSKNGDGIKKESKDNEDNDDIIKIEDDDDNVDQKPNFHDIKFRYNKEQFPITMIVQILNLIIKLDDNKMNDAKICCDSIDYLCKIGICVPCIYRIFNNFNCISDVENGKDLLVSLIKMEKETKIPSKNCFICNDFYLKLYESLINNKLLSQLSDIKQYEYKSYWLGIVIPPILTIRDFYIIHHLHYKIKGSSKLFTFPNHEIDDSHKDMIHFMIDTFSKPLNDMIINNNLCDNNNNNDNNKRIKGNRFGYTDGTLVEDTGINITFNFYSQFIRKYVTPQMMKKESVQSKQSKKRDKFRKWNRRQAKNRKDRLRGKYKKSADIEETKCMEYTFLKSNTEKIWFQSSHYMNNIKLFLMDMHSFPMRVQLCQKINKDLYLKLKLLPFDYKHKNDIDVKIDIKRPPIYIYGKYNKYARNVSQTPFAFAKSSILTLIVQAMRKYGVDNCDNNNPNNTIKIEDDDNNNDRNHNHNKPVKEEQDVEMKSSKDETKGNDNNDDNDNDDDNDNKHEKSEIVNPKSNEHGWIDIKQNVITNNLFCCDQIFLHSAGREDMNVRMLGDGRPLLLQLMNPRKTITLKSDDIGAKLRQFEKFVNENADGMIKIKELEIADKEKQEMMKNIENDKRKTYRAICWISKSFKNQKELDDYWKSCDIKFPLQLTQSTPLRVLHRRSLTDRTRSLFDIKLKWLSAQWVTVDITSQAGTYIKEFCHGDRGRTYPNLASLLKCNNANIIQLDVIAVQT